DGDIGQPARRFCRHGGKSTDLVLTVDDVDARVEKAKALGATITGEPMTVPGVGRMATLIDPVGGVLALITYEAPAES
ncbi:MAG: hypothetical protein AAFY24_22305, partial [Pseudomonadota bacterium]